MLKKIIGYIVAFFGGAIALFFAIKRPGIGEIDKRIDDNQRDIGKSSDRIEQGLEEQRRTIIDIVATCGEIRKTIGDVDRIKQESIERELRDQKLVDDSRELRERAKKFLAGIGD